MLHEKKEITSAQWNKIESLLDEALELPLGQRTLFLKQKSEENEELKTLLIGLWDAGKEATQFLEGDIPAEVVQAIDQISIEEAYGPAPTQGMRFGEYEVIEEIGRGGMSVVYKARRADGQFEQTVAMKILKRGMDTDLVVQRFLAERQILASLQHANIARLLDGGATPDGRPYLVMEYVEGQPITKYCDNAQLDIEHRLALFLKVSEAVEFAHRNLIVHRDLKPSNILVTADGDVKLLDFGIAKVISTEEDDKRLTLAGGRVMTPEYAAPEQIFGKPITTATDVYALGVILYEFVCGQLPLVFEVRTLAGIERAMRGHEAPFPSSKLQLGENAETTRLAAKQRGTTVGQLQKRVAGDLDLIIQKALRKEPDRRYRSVSELNEELNRFLNGLPVKVRPDSFGYRAKKFYGRYRTGVLLGSIALLLLVASVVGTFWQARVASAERDTAQREAATSLRVTEFLVEVFESIDPDNARGDTLTAYDILERGALRVESELSEEPDVQAEMMTVIGRMYHRMGSFDEAANWLERAHTARKEFPEDDLSLQRGSYSLAQAWIDQGHFAEAESLLVEVIASLDAELDEDQRVEGRQLYVKTLDLRGLAMIEKGQYKESRAFYQQALAEKDRLEGADSLDLASMYKHFGQVLAYLQEFEPAQTHFKNALEIYRKQPDESADEMALVLHEVALSFRIAGDYDAAEEAGREELDILERLFSKEHPLYVKGVAQYAHILADMGRHDEAEAMLLEALETQERSIGAEQPIIIQLLTGLGYNNGLLENNERALYYFRRAQVLRQKIMGDDHPTIAVGLSNIGVLERGLGNFKEAEELHRETKRRVSSGYGERHYGVGLSAAHLALDLHLLGNFDEALVELKDAEEILPKGLGPDHYFVATMLTNKGLIYSAKGEMEIAETAFKEAIEVYLKNDMADDHITLTSPKIGLGKLYLTQGRLDEAGELLEAAYKVRSGSPMKGNDWRLGESEVALGMYYLARNENGKAAELLRSGHSRLLDRLGPDNWQTRDAKAALESSGH